MTHETPTQLIVVSPVERLQELSFVLEELTKAQAFKKLYL